MGSLEEFEGSEKKIPVSREGSPSKKFVSDLTPAPRTIRMPEISPRKLRINPQKIKQKPS